MSLGIPEVELEVVWGPREACSKTSQKASLRFLKQHVIFFRTSQSQACYGSKETVGSIEQRRFEGSASAGSQSD